MIISSHICTTDFMTEVKVGVAYNDIANQPLTPLFFFLRIQKLETEHYSEHILLSVQGSCGAGEGAESPRKRDLSQRWWAPTKLL